jgi:hypothetical protein
MHSASYEIVRYAFAILKLMNLCTLVYFVLLYSFFIESIHTGAAYSNCGNIAPVYIVFCAPWLSSQLILADLDRTFINLVHLSVIYLHSVEQKSTCLKFSKFRTGSHMTCSCHHNLSRFTFPIFTHSWRFSVFHSLQSHRVYINRKQQYICLISN